MTRARPALLFVAAAAVQIGIAPLVFAVPSPPEAIGRGQPLQQVVLVVEDEVSFEQLLSIPLFDRLAAGGGVGLMTTHTRRLEEAEQVGEEPPVPYEAIALGTTEPPIGGVEPLMNQVLYAHGVEVCSLLDPTIAGGQRGSPTGYLARPGDGHDARQCPLSTPGASTRRLVVMDDGVTRRAQLQSGTGGALSDGQVSSALSADATTLKQALERMASGSRIAVVVVTPSPSDAMQTLGDEVTPILVTLGKPDFLLRGTGKNLALTSETTRHAGLVANVDVAPTILDFFGIPIPKEMTGSPIRIDGRADVEHLHRLHLDQRHIRLPLQLGEVAYVAGLGIVAIPMLIWLRVGRRLPGAVANVMAFLALCGAALPIPLMAGGLLPRLTYPVVVPFVVLSVLGLAAVARAARWPGRLGPFVFTGAVGLAFIVVDGLFGWRGMRIPLLGGTMFDGVRFYGLPNAFIATLLAGALFLATRLDPWGGALVLFGAGLFGGFPALGANVGASVTLFFAAGLWWILRTRGRFSLRDVLLVAGVVAVGLAAVLMANRYLPGAPTHITGFVERTRGGLGGVWDAFRRRLDVGIGQIRDVPAALIPLVGLLVILVAAVLRPEPTRSGLALAGEVWRDALIVLTLAGMAAFFANDTGVAAAAPVFMYAATAMAYPAFLAARQA